MGTDRLKSVPLLHQPVFATYEVKFGSISCVLLSASDIRAKSLHATSSRTKSGRTKFGAQNRRTGSLAPAHRFARRIRLSLSHLLSGAILRAAASDVCH